MTHHIKLLIPILCFLACSSQQPSQNQTADSIAKDSVILQPTKDSFPKGKIIEKVVCKNNTSQSYALYIPNNHNNEPLPVVYCFDPHGDGTLPLKNYRALADADQFILIGSNNSKNGNDWNTTQQMWNTLLADTQSRLPINSNRLYTCGF